MKCIKMILLAASIIMVSIYWIMGAKVLGGIGYSMLSIVFIINLVTTIRANKKQDRKDGKDSIEGK